MPEIILKLLRLHFVPTQKYENIKIFHTAMQEFPASVNTYF